mgnify:CR=1 FL=1
MIKFFRKNQPYYEFSNFYESHVIIDGISYKTIEAYFQSSKYSFSTASNEEKKRGEYIRNLPPFDAFKEGRKRIIGINIDPKWDDRKNNVMRKGVFRKFMTNEKLKQLLLSTKEKTLIEDSPYDSYWGIKKTENGIEGKNMLGKILEEVRYLLSDEPIVYPLLSDKSHWIIPTFLLSSAFPQSYKEIENFDIIVAVQTDDELKNFKSYTETELKFDSSKIFDVIKAEKTYARISIQDKGTISDIYLIKIIKRLSNQIAKHKRILVHCYGGKGRTGLIVTLLLGMIYGMTSKEALNIISKLFNLYRKDKGTKKCTMPQTKVQFDSVKSIL